MCVIVVPFTRFDKQSSWGFLFVEVQFVTTENVPKGIIDTLLVKSNIFFCPFAPECLFGQHRLSTVCFAGVLSVMYTLFSPFEVIQ